VDTKVKCHYVGSITHTLLVCETHLTNVMTIEGQIQTLETYNSL